MNEQEIAWRLIRFVGAFLQIGFGAAFVVVGCRAILRLLP
jgi:hypothetical protein